MVLTKNAFCKDFAGFSRFVLLSGAVIGGAVSIGGAPARAQAQPAAVAAPAQEPGMFDKVLGVVGLGGGNSARPAQSAAPIQVAPVTVPARAPVTVPAQAADTAPAQEPGMLDKVTGMVGLGGSPEASNIDYSERPKLVVPQQRNLPPAQTSVARPVAKPPAAEALTKPPSEYLQKVPGADGQVSGLKDGDVSKDKKFFGLF